MSDPHDIHPDDLVRAQEMQAALAARFAPAHLEVIDQSAAHAGHAGANAYLRGTHFLVRVGGVADFAGLGRVQKHRLIYECLAPFLQRSVHALSLEFLD